MSQVPRRTKYPVKHYSREEVEASTKKLDERVDRLTHSTLPKQPYIVSVPSDVPYRHSRSFVNTWYVGTPFDRHEEQLQYMSFLPHQDLEEEALIKVVGGWADDQGNLLEEETSSHTNFDSGRNTPLDQSNRKKITLKDYKKDKKPADQEYSHTPDHLSTQTRVPGSQGVVQKSQEHRTSPGNQKAAAPMEVAQDVAEVLDAEPTREQTLSQMDGADSPVTQIAIDGDSPRPSKRQKLSPSPHSNNLAAAIEDEALKSLPKLLSPTLPSPKPERDLPDLLSPLLPPSLARAMATPPPSSGHDATLSHQRSDSVKLMLGNALGDGTARSIEKVGPSSGSLGGSRVRSDSQHSVRSNASVSSSKNVTQVKASGSSTLRPGTPTSTPSRSPGPRQRHIIALKYGKKNRKRVEALLKFHARPRKVGKPPEPEGPSEAVRPQQPTKDSPKLEKNLGRSLEGLLVKDKRADSPTERLKRPTTPVPGALKSQMNGSSKSVYNTPQKELKSTAMRRVESTDGGNAATPGAKARSSTPIGFDKTPALQKPSPGHSSTVSTGEEERKDWSREGQKYHTLARSIKHEADSAHLEGKPVQTLLMIEALLGFMVHLSTQGMVRSSDPGWQSIMPYHAVTLRRSRKFSQLHGLVVQLGAICRQTMHRYHMQRLAKEPLPDDHQGSAPTPGSDGNTKTNEDSERNRRRYLRFRDELVENERELQTAWLEGSRALSPEVLRAQYAATWSNRSRDYSNRGLEKHTPGAMFSQYFLPMDASTTAFEAAAFGMTFIEEFALRGKVDWKPRIEV